MFALLENFRRFFQQINKDQKAFEEFWQQRNIRENNPDYLEPINSYSVELTDEELEEFQQQTQPVARCSGAMGNYAYWVPCGWAGWANIQPQSELLESEPDTAISPKDRQAAIKKNQELAGCFRCKYFNSNAYTSRAIISGCAVHPMGLDESFCSDLELTE